MEIERAELGVDGNAGFALLGVNIQEGEAEFETMREDYLVGSHSWHREGRRCAAVAYHRLKSRLFPKQISYWIGPSHPDHC